MNNMVLKLQQENESLRHQNETLQNEVMMSQPNACMNISLN